MKIITFKISLICIIITFFSSIEANVQDYAMYLKKQVFEKKLDNGITVLLLNRGYSPTLAFNISFRVGSVDETYRTAGAAHMLEHMLFKGTAKLGTKNYKKEENILKQIAAVGETIDQLELKNPKNILLPKLRKELKDLQKKQASLVISSPYDRIYTANGSRGFNASTSRDRTGYYIQLPSSKLQLWAKIESDRLKQPVMREYYLERNNVIQEQLMRYESRGSGMLFTQFIAHAFMAHPYRHPTIGWRSNIPYLSLSDIKHFFQKYYIPSRTTITIVGKQDVNKTFAVIKKYFSSLPSQPEPPEINIREPKQKGERRFIVRFKSKPQMIIGWHKPTFPSIHDYSFDVISDLLTSGKSSRLYKKLVLEKKLVSSVSSWNGAPGARYDNLFVIFVSPLKRNYYATIEKIIYEEIKKISHTVTGRELQKVRNSMESHLIFRLASNSGMASLLSYYQTVFKDWKYAARYLQKLKEIKQIHLSQAIKGYIKPQNRIVGILKE